MIIVFLVISIAMLCIAILTASYKAVKAPIIYLYPEQEQEVNVELDLNGELKTTYPRYENGWNVIATPEGTLTDTKGRDYDYLFWEADLDLDPDFSKGFCVAGDDTEEFLEYALAELGLNDSEANTFIMFWLPQMQGNTYNVISFQTEEYEKASVLNVYPIPDSEIRVFMTYYSLPYKISIEPQDFESLGNIQRTGFTLVEWGGTEVSSVNGEINRITK